MKTRRCRQLLPGRFWCLLAVLTLFVGGQLLLPSASVGADPLVPPGARGESVPCWVAIWKAAARPGSFNDLSDLAVDATGEVYTVDQQNERVQVFDADGAGNVYVADTGNNRVQKLSP